jgi:hypothetical protein
MKTAVEWLESEMLEHYSPFDNKLLYEAIHKAKEIEKEQKETYKYTEEDLRKAIELAKEGNYQRDWVGGIQVTDKYDKDEIIKVINQSKQQEQ